MQRSIISREQAISEVEFENAKSSLIFEVIEEEETPGDKSNVSMMSYLLDLSRNYNRCA